MKNNYEKPKAQIISFDASEEIAVYDRPSLSVGEEEGWE